eukprot:TRINITY_DN32188_c0_g1_i1.p1 TRINITY_DN32188_c0_g1~~TRINITY_DN32188_c0_g1_i1.p1  ORF type:complete len:283 (-),score=48.86 TRINITY_DN32188_c0_g1_i1:259-1107(-)
MDGQEAIMMIHMLRKVDASKDILEMMSFGSGQSPANIDGRPRSETCDSTASFKSTTSFDSVDGTSSGSENGVLEPISSSLLLSSSFFEPLATSSAATLSVDSELPLPASASAPSSSSSHLQKTPLWNHSGSTFSISLEQNAFPNSIGKLEVKLQGAVAQKDLDEFFDALWSLANEENCKKDFVAIIDISRASAPSVFSLPGIFSTIASRGTPESLRATTQAFAIVSSGKNSIIDAVVKIMQAQTVPILAESVKHAESCLQERLLSLDQCNSASCSYYCASVE